ncbi:MAG: SIMPL domain-containing protein [Pirellula sp.]|jgi:hypothetical protein
MIHRIAIRLSHRSIPLGSIEHRCLYAMIACVGIAGGLNLEVGHAQLPGSVQSVEVGRTPGISITVQEPIAMQPQLIQLKLPFKVESRDAEDALANLKEHLGKVEQECLRLGAAKESIRFSSPVIGTITPGVDNLEMAKQALKRQAAQMQANNPNMRGKLRSMLMGDEEEDSEGDEEGVLPFFYTASSKLTAEWKLPNGMDDAAVLLTAKLKAGTQNKLFQLQQKRVPLTEEEMDVVQPLIAASVYYGVSMSNTPVESPIQFVALLKEEQEEAAMKRAFERATMQSNRLARAAGKKLSDVRHLSSIITVNQAPSQNNAPVNVGESKESGERRIVSANPNELTATLSLTIVYALADE